MQRMIPIGEKPRLYKDFHGAWCCASYVELPIIFSFMREPMIVLGAGATPKDAYNRWNFHRRKLKS